MLGGNSVEPRHEFIDARIIFHCAGAQRIHAQVDGVVPRGKPREVAQHFDLAHFGKSFDAFAAIIRSQGLRWIGRGHIERRQFERPLSGGRFLEDQSFVLIGMRCGFLNSFLHSQLSALKGAALWKINSAQIGCLSARSSAPANRSISAREVVSVTQTSARFVSSGYAVPNASGPIILSRSSCVLISFTERGNSTTNSLKNGASNVRRTPGIFSNSESANCAFEKFCCAISRKPSLPSRVKCTVAASAQSAWLVQIFEVAFSRRMCCSRVARVSTNPRRPSVSVVCPDRRPGICRTNLSREAITPANGPP